MISHNQAQKERINMNNNNIAVGIENYPDLLQQTCALLGLSLPEIKKKYADYPHCLIEHFEQGSEDKSMEIRFDKEERTITCLFNKDDKCDFVYLFPDKNEFIEEFILFLKDTCYYDFIKNYWKASNYYIKVKEIDPSSDDVCLMFYCY